MSNKDDIVEGKGPAGGWGSLKGIASISIESSASPSAVDTLRRMNKPGGLMCPSCAWPKPKNYSAFEFCENGAKAVMWELTRDRCTPAFWETHTVQQLRTWTDHELEKTGRLTHPLRYNPQSDRYEEVDWESAFKDIAANLNALDPESAVFYASGHAGLEASYLYALMARLHGNNNLPQSSNMCHETTSVGLSKVIGSPVGTIIWEDLEQADAFFFFGQNPGTNSPRFLHPLRDAKKRGGKIVTFNPIIEQGLVAFVDPQNPIDMTTGRQTKISDQYHQLSSGGDVAAIMGICKHVIEADKAAQRNGSKRIIDVAFIDEHTQGFDSFLSSVEAAQWNHIEAGSGLTRQALLDAADVYMKAERVIGVYGMGLTQHTHGSVNVGMLVNLLMLRGNIGRLGAGVCPVRGHSNVQGQRTVGIAEKASLIPMDKLRQLFDFNPPLKDGVNIVEMVEGLIAGSVKASICLGGNLLRAVPDQRRMEESWAQQNLTVMVSTKLNRSHVFPGKSAYILPCLGRAEVDEQASGPQAVSTEDSFSMISGSTGHRSPASEHLKSELAIVTGIARALLPDNPNVKWEEWTADYSLVRDLIEQTYPDDFGEFNKRMFEPGGFYRGIAAHERIWKTPEKKALFTTPERLTSLGFDTKPGRYSLLTMRSNDQFNTTIYGYSDRFHGIEGTRDVLLMNPDDIERAGLSVGDRVQMITDLDDGVDRRLGGLVLTPYRIPVGTVASYYPECNVLVPVSHHDQLSKTPGSKSVPVRIEREPDEPAI
ncbi:MAG TPA: FdhF/YdeP family oxidoreductase [Marinobacter sp.]|uniref:FdhF/YdeP family oxidoreductase n=2 Tax=root TaxID=1 RepID=A0A831R688_9GAMM|nr:FdhF/YdeP family oxidoreductase [Marinobacter antarcticus]HDZ39097.1 FdhF/YdeP family oxidoreductase [Marinobacter sp.]HEA53558.1 FdhF/YdeP family oxidoreductase [Marinobacter antarcticus]